MDVVDETLRDWRRHPHQYGVNDCVLSAAAYFVRLDAADALPAFAGTYADSDEAMAILTAHGGMEQMMEIVGGTPVDDPPQRGDIIGLIADAEYVIPAMCTGDRVVVRLERGTIEVPLKFVQWRGVWRGFPRGKVE